MARIFWLEKELEDEQRKVLAAKDMLNCSVLLLSMFGMTKGEG